MSITRRTLLSTAAITGGALLSGCDKLGQNERFRSLLGLAEDANFTVHRSLQSRTALAREFSPADLSPIFRANGTREPPGDAYAKHKASNFADWRVAVDGLVEKPLSLSIAQLRDMPTRTQITRHDCVEGWSAIGKWSGVPLKLVLDEAVLKPSARFVVFHCADMMKGEAAYYESLDLIDANHPQTILAWDLNDKPLPVGNGAPLRLRVERQLGYKHAKYVERIELVDDLTKIGRGKGGFWEDQSGYEWYGGI
jgi:DMSO/TMAO reductase YedYZ molybdopterin-dependent catalytic subunit